MDPRIFEVGWWAMIAAVPSLVIWGWARWLKRTLPTPISYPSLIGFTLATASALLAVFTFLKATLGRGFGYYDPLLLTIYKIGLLLSLIGLIFGIGGLGKAGPLRWHAPVCSIGMLVFWFLAAISE